MDIESFPTLLQAALQRREKLLQILREEGTDAYRILHGVAEGASGLTIDRYSNLILVQTFREPLSPEELGKMESVLSKALPESTQFVYNHRGKKPTESFDLWHQPSEHALAETSCQEWGTRFLIRARHSGIDPWLFLDLRTGRRFLRKNSAGKSLLNLFAYTCSVGVSAAAAGASEVWNVDFARSSLEVGLRNAAQNGVSSDRFKIIEEDCLPVMRQLAGLPTLGRARQKNDFKKVEPRQFDFVFLDPPAWSKGAFGAVDVVGDYPSLFKSAVLSAKSNGGCVIATHHVATVALDTWTEILQRCANKAGRPIREMEVLKPEEDFPSFDGHPPLKIAVCWV